MSARVSRATARLRHGALARVALDDHARVLKLLVTRHRDQGRSKSNAACRLHALLMELEPGGMAKEMTVTRANEILDRIEPATQMTEHLRPCALRRPCTSEQLPMRHIDCTSTPPRTR